jgi:hypothetical protein
MKSNFKKHAASFTLSAAMVVSTAAPILTNTFQTGIVASAYAEYTLASYNKDDFSTETTTVNAGDLILNSLGYSMAVYIDGELSSSNEWDYNIPDDYPSYTVTFDSANNRLCLTGIASSTTQTYTVDTDNVSTVLAGGVKAGDIIKSDLNSTLRICIDNVKVAEIGETSGSLEYTVPTNYSEYDVEYRAVPDQWGFTDDYIYLTEKVPEYYSPKYEISDTACTGKTDTRLKQLPKIAEADIEAIKAFLEENGNTSNVYIYATNTGSTSSPFCIFTYLNSTWRYSTLSASYVTDKYFITSPKPAASGTNVALTDAFNINIYSDTAQFATGGKFDGYTPSMEVKTAENATPTTVNAVSTADGYKFENAFKLPAKNLGNLCYYRVVATKNDDVVYGDWITYSARYYMGTLATSSDDAKIKALATDILNYAAAAQTYFGYNTGSLVNSSVDQNNATIVDDPTAPVLDGDVAGDFTYTGSSLLLKDNVIIRHYVTSDSVLADATGTKTIDGTLNYYYDTEVSPDEFGTTKVTQIGTGAKAYSVNYYIYRTLNNSNSSDELKALCRKLYAYGESAKSYSTPAVTDRFTKATSANDIINNLTTDTGLSPDDAIELAKSSPSYNQEVDQVFYFTYKDYLGYGYYYFYVVHNANSSEFLSAQSQSTWIDSDISHYTDNVFYITQQ